MLKGFLPAALVVLTVATVHARPTRDITFRTLCLQPHRDMAELVILSATKGGKAIQVPLYTMSVSREIKGSFMGDEAVFFAPAPGRKAPPEGAVPVASGKLASSKHQLLVFVPVISETGPLGYEVHAFNDDVKSFKMGSILAINLGPRPVRFTMAGELMPPIPAGEHATYPQAKKVNDYNMYPAAAEFQGEDEAWTTAYSASWKASDRRREIVITLVDAETGRPAVKMISDVPSWIDE